MKYAMTLVLLSGILAACDGKGQKETLDAPSDEQMVTEIVNDIEQNKKQLSQSTEETLSEVDSLLENL